jgi:hypothetical protein
MNADRHGFKKRKAPFKRVQVENKYSFAIHFFGLGRSTSSPLQFGHTEFIERVHFSQNVHSKLQM